MATQDFTLKIWRCHPSGAKIIPAEKTCHGTAHEGGVKWCGPFTNANKFGWWMFPPVDIDILWKGGREFEYNLLTPYSDADWHLLRSLLRSSDNSEPDRWSPPGGRTKFTWGAVEEGLIQMWTGCIFETPPGWCLHIKSPTNFPHQPYQIMEGILETDWMQYDIWFNVKFTEKDKWVHLRKDQWPPLAQICPIRREGFHQTWNLEEETINRDSDEANRVFEYWVEYNGKKFENGGNQFVTHDGKVRKDSGTFLKERNRILGKEAEPDPGAVCPYHQFKKENKLKPRLVKKNPRHSDGDS